MPTAVPSIALADLQPPTSGIVGPTGKFVTAAELLAVGLSRHGAVVLRLPAAEAAAVKAGLSALLAGDTTALPGCESQDFRAGGARASTAIEEAYGTLDAAARSVLAALCRSSLLRLRSDALSAALDDRPLPRSARGSSLLRASSAIDNFSQLSASESASVMPLFVDPQDAAIEAGLLTLLCCNEARSTQDPSSQPLSALQVQDSRGCWQDVQLAAGEVAVLAGHTLQHATAGLVRAGSHRVVGSPFKTRRTQGRTVLSFDLRPRPSAVLDLRPQLEAAGHAVGSSYSPVSVSTLLEQFEALLSPAAKVATPDQQQGAAAHAAWEELQASLKRSKKRTSAVGAAGRGASARRSSGGAGEQPQGRMLRSHSRQQMQAGGENGEGVNAMDVDGGSQQQKQKKKGSRQSGGGSAAAAPLRPSSAGNSSAAAVASTSQGSTGGGGLGRSRSGSLEPGASLLVARGHTCQLVDDCLEGDPAQAISVCVRSFTGMERWFYQSITTRLGSLFEIYCSRLGIPLGAVKFLRKGERVFGAATPDSLGMRDGEELTVVPESSDRLQQQRELGPLFGAVFGAAAARGSQQKLELL